MPNTVFIVGAGATRGSSFVNSDQDPCLPPLDTDFFTQLQKVSKTKHFPAIKATLKDVTEIFGHNFECTLEDVFTYIEQGIKLIEMGSVRGFPQKNDYMEKRQRLLNSVGIVFEDSMCVTNEKGESTREFKKCEYHEKLIKFHCRKKDGIISFNYDCSLDLALKLYGDKKWNAHYGYGLNLGAKGSNLSGDDFWTCKEPALEKDTLRLYKLHGSLHFQIRGKKVRLKQRPYTTQNGNMNFDIIPPEWNKNYKENPVFARVWHEAAKDLTKAKNIIFIGYSLPKSDLHTTALLRFCLKNPLDNLVVVNPDRHARKRVRTILQRAINENTKVISIDTFKEFVNLRPEIYRN